MSRKKSPLLLRLLPVVLIALLLWWQNRPAPDGNATTETAAPATAAAPLRILAGSEIKDIEPLLHEAAQQAGIALQLQYAGTLDIVERINAGETFDALLPPNGAYPALALETPPLAREKLFYSRVTLGVKQSKARELGWLQQPPTWAQIAQAAGKGQLRYAMTNPTSSNTGMSALFAVASAVAGKTEDLQVQEVDEAVLKDFLRGQTLTAGSSGWLADAFAQNPQALDGIVNYEAVILRLNTRLPASDPLILIYPQDGVITADYPLMLLREEQRGRYQQLVAAIKSPAMQQRLSKEAGLRPAIPQARPPASLPDVTTAELSFPNRLDVIDAILLAYQGEWRRPATSIFVLDTSASMFGPRIAQVREALKVLAGASSPTATASTRYARFQHREQVALIAFSNQVSPATFIDFSDPRQQQQARDAIVAYADALDVNGGTAIYSALLAAQNLARTIQAEHPDRFVSIVLLTDGENTVRPSLRDYLQRIPPNDGVRVFPILFGEANQHEMQQLAAHTGGRIFDGRTDALRQVFQQIRGYQ